MRNFFEQALDNIIEFGDTDIFPFSIENHIFYDCKESTLDLLEDIHKKFDDMRYELPPNNERTLVPAGYTGFRLATQLDPIWNAYLLGIVLSISESIEKKRIPKEQNKIFSYRFLPNKETKKLFDANYGYNSFLKESLKKALEYSFVLNTDISNFYGRIYHHKLENALSSITNDSHIVKRIDDVLSQFSNTESYGLPVGGPAARILAEACLNNVDQLLNDKNIEFSRFVDDYYIFGKSESDIYEKLLILSDLLIKNGGLTLQKSKTRILKTSEFISAYSYISQGETQNKHKAKISIKDQQRALLMTSLKYDPYSQTAEEDYQKLKKEIKQLDIEGMLMLELEKSRVNTQLAKKLLKAVKLLDDNVRERAVLSLLENLDTLFPVIPQTLILINDVFKDLSENTQKEIIKFLIFNLKGEETGKKADASCDKKTKKNFFYIFQIDINIRYTLKILAQFKDSLSQSFLTDLFESTKSKLIKSEIILIMTKWKVTHWLENKKYDYESFSPTEKRAFVIATYFMNDSGRHWRDNNSGKFSKIELLYKEWASSKKNKNQNWEVPT